MENSTSLTSSTGNPRRPLAMAPSLKAKLSTAANGIERAPGGHSEIRSDYALTTDERAAIERRRLDLISALTPGERIAVQRRLGRFFNLFASGAMDEKTAAGIVDDYARLLASQPLWAIDQACIAVINKGETFRPSAPELLLAARAACQTERTELMDMERVLAARIYQVGTPEMRKRVKDGFDRLLGKTRLPSDHEQAEADRLAALADLEARAAYWKSPLMSERVTPADPAPEF